jgi:hypothetical protein
VGSEDGEYLDGCGVEEERKLVGLKCVVASWLAVAVQPCPRGCGRNLTVRNTLSHSGENIRNNDGVEDVISSAGIECRRRDAKSSFLLQDCLYSGKTEISSYLAPHAMSSTVIASGNSLSTQYS